MNSNSAPLYRKPSTKNENIILQIWKEYLDVPQIGIDDNFFDLGGNSILVEQITSRLKDHFELHDFDSTLIFQYPTIASLSENISLSNTDKNSSKTQQLPDQNTTTTSNKDIAVIGVSGRFPGAKNIDELWENLKIGKSSITFFDDNELDESIPNSIKTDKNYVKARGIVPSAKKFDADFFGLSQKLAEIMDPQIRIFLEICWEVLEENGYLNEHYKGSVGVYAGVGNSSYYKENILPNKKLLDEVGKSISRSLNEEFIATRTAYHLNLNGPAVNVQSACSTSLLAIAQGVDALRNGHCDVVLAGASSITSPINSGHTYQEGAIFSKDGSCKPFDANANGTVFSDGAGVVLLKPLDKAIEDGDSIHGVIKGIGINNDGSNKSSFTAPNFEGQAKAIQKAIIDADVKASDISYIEAHGTATPIGDPIEFKGLQKAFGSQTVSSYCALGSIKSNLGHLTAAAGVAGFIKTLLAFKHQQIPPTVGFKSLNPAIKIDNTPFYINTKLEPWNTENKRIAGVSSFGVGGTNVHVILEEFKNVKPQKTLNKQPYSILTWSATNQVSQDAYLDALEGYIKSNEINMSDVAYTLQNTRASFNNRSFALVKNSENFKNLNLKNIARSAALKEAPNKIGFLFPGQGSQFINMGKTLYLNENVYRDAVDECALILNSFLDLDIREILYPETTSEASEKNIQNTKYTQPALFVTEYALARLWINWGITPNILCGHSIGEFVAAHLSGIFSLKDALQLIAKRGELIASLDEGNMLSVRLPEKKLVEILPNNLSIAAVNSKFLSVVSGNIDAVNEFSKTLEIQEIPHKILNTSHAFHSSMMEPILKDFEDAVKKTKQNTPNIPIISTVTGKLLTEEEATSTTYWVNHLRNTVRFSDAINTLLEKDNSILIEVGPGKTLTSLTHQQNNKNNTAVFSSLLYHSEQEDEYVTLLNNIGELWLKGITPNWKAFYASNDKQLISLPSYVFNRKPCWIEPKILSNKSNNNSAFTETNYSQKSNGNSKILGTHERVAQIIKSITGIKYDKASFSKNFLELGLDSLSLTQLAVNIKKEFELPVTFKQLNENLISINLLAEYLDEKTENKIAEVEPVVSLNNTNYKDEVTIADLFEQLKNISNQISKLQSNQNSISKEVLDKISTNNHQDVLQNTKTLKINKKNISAQEPPIPGAKLGRDEKGNPAWYVIDENSENKFTKIEF